MDGDVRVGVGDAVEEGVVLEEGLEAADVDHAGDDEEEEGDGEGEAAPGGFEDAGAALVEGAGAAGDDEVDGGGGAEDQGEREEPVVEEIPGGEGEEIEIEGLAEDGIGEAGGGAGSVPEEGERGPVFHHGGAAEQCDDDGDDEGPDAQDGFDGEVNRLTVEDEGVGAGEVGLIGSAEGREGGVEDEEGEDREGCEDAGLQGDHLPEDFGVAERGEPEEIDPGGEEGAAGEEGGDDEDGDENEETATPCG